jgi:hypothetical protein
MIAKTATDATILSDHILERSLRPACALLPLPALPADQDESALKQIVAQLYERDRSLCTEKRVRVTRF